MRLPVLAAAAVLMAAPAFAQSTTTTPGTTTAPPGASATTPGATTMPGATTPRHHAGRQHHHAGCHHAGRQRHHAGCGRPARGGGYAGRQGGQRRRHDLAPGGRRHVDDPRGDAGQQRPRARAAALIQPGRWSDPPAHLPGTGECHEAIRSAHRPGAAGFRVVRPAGGPALPAPLVSRMTLPARAASAADSAGDRSADHASGTGSDGGSPATS